MFGANPARPNYRQTTVLGRDTVGQKSLKQKARGSVEATQTIMLDQLWQEMARARQLSPAAQRVLDPHVLRSWQRCLPRLDPSAPPRPTVLKDSALERVVMAHFELVAIARPVMEEIFQYSAESEYALLLADRTGCVLDRLGDPALLAWLDELLLQPGAYWNEGGVGTNAVDLSLGEAIPVQLTGAAHFLSAFHALTLAAAPIHDAKGRIVGALAMAGRAATAHFHTLSTVAAGARAVANQLQTDHYLQEANFRLAELNSVFSAISEGVLAWDSANLITHINKQAGEMLGIHPRAVLGRPLSMVVRLPPSLHAAISAGEALKDSEVLLETDARQVECLLSLRPVHGGHQLPDGFIATLRPIEHVRQWVHRTMGTEATLTLDDLVGNSPPMRRVRRQGEVAARGTAPVLLQGENGIGKYPLAQAIHNGSARAGHPFITVNCGSLLHETMVSEFLGYEEGAYPEARAGRPSKFELADQGTLLLSEIESLTLEMQAALLQVIHTGQVMRLGGTRAIPVDVRLIATTTVDLEQRVADGTFRRDLLFRFGVFMIQLPPLRERPQDMPLLIERMLEPLSQRFQQPLALDKAALQKLQRYPWPGNGRELASVLERAAAHCDGPLIQVDDLPIALRDEWLIQPDHALAQPVQTLAEAERTAILRAGWAHQGHISHMAESLGVSRTTLWRKLNQFNLDAEYFKQSLPDMMLPLPNGHVR